MRSILTVVLILVCMATVAQAEDVVVRDNWNNKVTMSQEAAEAKGLKYTPLETLNLALEEDVPLGYTPFPFDLELVMGAVGNNDATGESETGVIGAALKWYPGATWVKFGPQITKSGNASDRIDVSIPVDFYIWPRPFTNLKPFVTANLFTASIPTGGAIGDITSHFSINPSASFGVEVPVESFSFAFQVGAQHVFTELGENVNEWGGWGAATKVVYRGLGR